MNPLQYELQFEASRYRRRQSEKLVRPSVARWWFAEMRRVVDQALDWHVGSQPKPEQTTLSLSPG